jgi:hypothetical protein
MMGSTAAIPTELFGVRFRSRLEAKWAAVFTRHGWGWTYEPFDCDRYIPDFLVKIPDRPPLLIEIKPAVTSEDYLNAYQKVFTGTYDWPHAVLILGANPYYEDAINTSAGLFWHRKHPNCIATATWWVKRPDGGASIKASFTFGGHVRGRQFSTDAVDRWWREAGNEVQWKRR